MAEEGPMGKLEDSLEVSALLLLVLLCGFWGSSCWSGVHHSCHRLSQQGNVAVHDKFSWYKDQDNNEWPLDTAYQTGHGHVISDLMGKKRRDKHLCLQAALKGSEVLFFSLKLIKNIHNRQNTHIHKTNYIWNQKSLDLIEHTVPASIELDVWISTYRDRMWCVSWVTFLMCIVALG